MEDKKVLFIEGEPNSPNGNLRDGFIHLLSQKVSKLPKIKFGGGKSIVAKQYLKNKFDRECFLLFDLDKPEVMRTQDLEDYQLTMHHPLYFTWCRRWKSWFLSQPDVLDKYYGVTIAGKKVSEKLKN